MRISSILIKIQRQRRCKLMAVSLSTSAKKASAKVFLQILGTDTQDTTPSLFLFADSQRYLFNCGEGTQRIFNQHKLKLTRINNIFFTRICWEYIGGLPGLAMTLRDNGKSDLGLLGPSNLRQFIHATRFFLFHENLKFGCTGFTGREGEKYEDENLTIWPVLLNEKHEGVTSQLTKSHPDEIARSTDDSTYSSSSDESEQPSIKKWKQGSKSSSICYICQLASLPGKFSPQKAKELGVPRGPLFTDLQLGEAVTLEDGQLLLDNPRVTPDLSLLEYCKAWVDSHIKRTWVPAGNFEQNSQEITPEQVIGPVQPGPVFIIIDCPTLAFIPSLVSNKQLKQHCENQYWEEGPKKIPVVMVHLTPMEVFQSKEYEVWRKRFGNDVSHVLINKDVCATPMVFHAQAAVQCRLHSIDPEIFPLLKATDIPKVSKSELPKKCFPGETLLKIHLRPVKQQGFDKSEIPQKVDFDALVERTRTFLASKLNRSVATELVEKGHDRKEFASSPTSVSSLSTNSSAGSTDVIASPEGNLFSKIQNPVRDMLDGAVREPFLRESCEETVQVIHGQVKSQEITHADYEVVFLGTGASIPSKYRNASSTLINMSEKGSMLLDCGEGTYGQLFRHYDRYVDRVLLQLKCVFISHIHADHHLGLIRILQKRDALENKSPGDPLLIIGPDKIRKWLLEYSSWCEDIDYRFVDSRELNVSRDEDYFNVNSHLDAKEVLTVPVDHCPEAYGLVVKHQRGWKIVYSGDTRPCRSLIEAGKDADLLIHEATLEDDLKAEAVAKKHSTTTEAIEIGVKMDAKFIMLNHFSQRYPKIPVFSEQFTKYTGIAFDHMKIHSSNFSKVPQLLGPLKTVFSEEIEERNKSK